MVTSISRYTHRYFELSSFVQFAFWLALILIIKYDTLLAPPVWDTAMGVFPPAIFLAENNFNILQLIQQEGWWQGGPNVHSFSSWTWFIAVVMVLIDNPKTIFFILHAITFLVCAYAISKLVLTARQIGLNSSLSLLSGLFLLLLPLVLVQIGYMYTESLVMAFSILGWVSWCNQREGSAVFYSLLAISVKLTGIVIGLCILPLLVLRLMHKFSIKRLLLIVSIPSFYYIATSIYVWLGGADITPYMPLGDFGDLLVRIKIRLIAAPDLTLLILLSICVSIFHLIYKWLSTKSFNPVPRLYAYCVTNGSSVIVTCYLSLFCLAVLLMTYKGNLFLFRYAVPMMPFVILQLAIAAHSFRIQSVAVSFFIAFCLFSIYNHNGKIYTTTRTFSITEHSHDYKTYVLAQKTMIDHIAELDDTTPIYVSREIDYMTSHPEMGYLNKLKPNIVGLYKSEYSGLSVDDLPSEFYVVQTNPRHGGVRLFQTIGKVRTSDAKKQGWRTEKIVSQRIGKRYMTMHRIYKGND